MGGHIELTSSVLGNLGDHPVLQGGPPWLPNPQQSVSWLLEAQSSERPSAKHPHLPMH
jgi:hypothetical protein